MNMSLCVGKYCSSYAVLRGKPLARARSCMPLGPSNGLHLRSRQRYRRAQGPTILQLPYTPGEPQVRLRIYLQIHRLSAVRVPYATLRDHARSYGDWILRPKLAG